MGRAGSKPVSKTPENDISCRIISENTTAHGGEEIVTTELNLKL